MNNQQLEKIDISNISLEMAMTRADCLQKVVETILRPGIDYGTVPGISQPFLLKPGAQRLLANWGLRPDPELKDSHEDWVKGIFHYRYKVTIYTRDGQPLGAAERACNNQEDKFRFHWVDAPERDKQQAEAMVLAKIGRWKRDGDFWQWQEKEEVSNPYDQINNVLARAQKRGVSAATENTFAAAGFFATDDAKRKAKSIKKDDGATAFWLHVRTHKIADAVARPLADEATANKITWKQAIERLPKP